MAKVRCCLDSGHGDEPHAGVLDFDERVGEHLPDPLVDAPHAVAAHPIASRSLQDAKARSILTPWGKRLSRKRWTVSAHSSQRPSEPATSDTASTERCHVSCPSTSATAAPSLSRSHAFTLFSSARLAFSEPA